MTANRFARANFNSSGAAHAAMCARSDRATLLNPNTMTVAVCLKCGSFKFGSFNPCEKCGALPDTEDDYALSFIYSSHFFPHEELEDIGRQIASGKKAVLKPDMLPPEMMQVILERSREMKAMCERMWSNANEQGPDTKAPPDSG